MRVPIGEERRGERARGVFAHTLSAPTATAAPLSQPPFPLAVLERERGHDPKSTQLRRRRRRRRHAIGRSSFEKNANKNGSFRERAAGGRKAFTMRRKRQRGGGEGRGQRRACRLLAEASSDKGGSFSMEMGYSPPKQSAAPPDDIHGMHRHSDRFSQHFSCKRIGSLNLNLDWYRPLRKRYRGHSCRSSREMRRGGLGLPPPFSLGTAAGRD